MASTLPELAPHYTLFDGRAGLDRHSSVTGLFENRRTTHRRISDRIGHHTSSWIHSTERVSSPAPQPPPGCAQPRRRRVMSTSPDTTAVRPFRVEVSQASLDDLRKRVLATRWP